MPIVNRDVHHRIASSLDFENALKLAKHQFVRIFKIKSEGDVPAFFRPYLVYITTSPIYIVDAYETFKYLVLLDTATITFYIKTSTGFIHIVLRHHSQTMDTYNTPSAEPLATNIVKHFFRKLVFEHSKTFEKPQLKLAHQYTYVHPAHFKVLDIAPPKQQRKIFKYTFEDRTIVHITFEVMQDDEELTIIPHIKLTAKKFQLSYRPNAHGKATATTDITPHWQKAYSVALMYFDYIDKKKFAKRLAIYRAFDVLNFPTNLLPNPIFVLDT